MADSQAWAEGAVIGSERAKEHRAHKQEMSDQQFQDKHDEIQGKIENLHNQLDAVPKDQRNTPDYLKMQDQLAQAIQDRNAHWKSVDQSNALMKFGKMLGKDLRFKKQESPVPVAPPVYGQPTMDVNGEKVPTGPAYKVQGPQTPAQMKAAAEAAQLVAAAPLSPEQQATTTANAGAAGNLASIQAALKNFDTLNPDATQEERNSFRNTLIQRGLLGQEKPTLKLYTLPDGTKAWLDATRPDLIPPGSTAAVTETEGTRKRADFEEFRKKYKETNGKDYTGTFESWNAEQAGIGRNAAIAAKPPNRDDRYISILQKAQGGQPLTPDDIAYKGAYDLWVQKTKIDPGVARMAALNNDRYTWVYDLNDPDKNLHPMRMADAAKSPIGTPQNIAFKTDTAITRAFTSGTPAQTINYFNTAIEHLKLLQEATNALNNGDVQLFNRYANAWATATGNPAPNNFDTVRNAVSGELSKTFKGTGATDEEIGLISGTINNAQSPDQLYGGIDYDLRLMQGKMQALQGQYEAGKQGKPNFPGATPEAGGNTPQYIYAKDEKGKLHKAKVGVPLPKGWTLTSAPTK
jgi:hypothetical protein